MTSEVGSPSPEQIAAIAQAAKANEDAEKAAVEAVAEELEVVPEIIEVEHIRATGSVVHGTMKQWNSRNQFGK